MTFAADSKPTVEDLQAKALEILAELDPGTKAVPGFFKQVPKEDFGSIVAKSGAKLGWIMFGVGCRVFDVLKAGKFYY